MPLHNMPTPPSSTVLILGMHRSGTSCLVGSLQQKGLYLGPVMEHSPHNPKGSHEHPLIRHLNSAVLQYSGGRWDKPPARIRWHSRHAKVRDQLISIFHSQSSGPWGFKDPRTLLTLPFWQASLRHLQYVATFRHPLRVAQSLQVRNDMPIRDGLSLWLQYNIQLLALISHKPVHLISFDIPSDQYRHTLDSIVQQLALHHRPDIPDIEEPPFFEDQLRHQSSLPDETCLSADIRAVYTQLIRRYQAQCGSEDKP